VKTRTATTARRLVRRLLAAVDRVLAAAREIEQARAALAREAERASARALQKERDSRAE
jgi:hypothetical protein